MITFQHAVLVGKPCVIDPYFASSMKMMCDKAKTLGLRIHITNAYRKKADHLSGTVVEPAKMSNHFIGHAIDCNIIEGKIWWNDAKLDFPSGKVLELIEYVEKNGMRWGGRFAKQDSVHFDDGINLRQPMMYKQKYLLIHQ